MVGIARDLVGGYYTGFVMMAVFSFLSLAVIALLRIKITTTGLEDHRQPLRSGG